MVIVTKKVIPVFLILICTFILFAGSFRNVYGTVDLQDLEFTTDITDTDIKIHSLKALKVDSELEFTIDYECSQERDFIIFNPLDEDKFIIFKNCGMQPGRHIVTFRVPAYKLSGVNDVAIKIYEPNVDGQDFRFLYSSEISKGIRNLIDFVTAKDIIVYQWDIQIVGSDVKFMLDYESSGERDFIIFNPPDGEKFTFSRNSGLQAVRNAITVRVPIDKLLSVNELTVRIYEPNADGRNFISFNTDQIRNLIDYQGDTDSDGDVDADDAAKILRYIVLTDTLTENEREMADVDGDGLVTALDASYVLKKVAGLIDKFPVE